VESYSQTSLVDKCPDQNAIIEIQAENCFRDHRFVDREPIKIEKNITDELKRRFFRFPEHKRECLIAILIPTKTKDLVFDFVVNCLGGFCSRIKVVQIIVSDQDQPRQTVTTGLSLVANWAKQLPHKAFLLLTTKRIMALMSEFHLKYNQVNLGVVALDDPTSGAFPTRLQNSRLISSSFFGEKSSLSELRSNELLSVVGCLAAMAWCSSNSLDLATIIRSLDGRASHITIKDVTSQKLDTKVEPKADKLNTLRTSFYPSIRDKLRVRVPYLSLSARTGLVLEVTAINSINCPTCKTLAFYHITSERNAVDDQCAIFDLLFRKDCGCGDNRSSDNECLLECGVVIKSETGRILSMPSEFTVLLRPDFKENVESSYLPELCYHPPSTSTDYSGWIIRANEWQKRNKLYGQTGFLRKSYDRKKAQPFKSLPLRSLSHSPIQTQWSQLADDLPITRIPDCAFFVGNTEGDIYYHLDEARITEAPANMEFDLKAANFACGARVKLPGNEKPLDPSKTSIQVKLQACDSDIPYFKDFVLGPFYVWKEADKPAYCYCLVFRKSSANTA